MSARKARAARYEPGPWDVPGLSMNRVPADLAFPIAVLLAARWTQSGQSLTEDESFLATHAAMVCADRLGLIAWPIPGDGLVQVIDKVMATARVLVEQRLTSPSGP